MRRFHKTIMKALGLRSLDAAIDELELAIVADHRRDPVSRLAASVPGVGALATSAILASAPDPQAFKSGRDFAAWLGATPKQNSTGGAFHPTAEGHAIIANGATEELCQRLGCGQ